MHWDMSATWRQEQKIILAIKSLWETSFNPLPSLEQSSPKDLERTSCALKILTQLTQLLCSVVIWCFPVAYSYKYLQVVFIISVTISYEKKRTLKLFFMVTLTAVCSRNIKQHLQAPLFHTGRVQEWAAGTDARAQGMVSVWSVPQDCEAESARLSSGQGQCSCWVVFPQLALPKSRPEVPGRAQVQQQLLSTYSHTFKKSG